MSKKESVFVSSVVYANNSSEGLLQFIESLYREMDLHFNHFEIVIVDNCVPNISLISDAIKSQFLESDAITIVHMSEIQNIETCMRAGVDVAIGDFVYEFEGLDYNFNSDTMWKAYQKALEGYDIVNAEIKDNSFSRALFYKMFNKFSRSQVDLYAVAFRLVSRRAINRVISLDLCVDWRNAAYATCGLKTGSVDYGTKASSKKNRDFYLAIDCFLLYSNLPRKIATRLGILGGIFFIIGIIAACSSGAIPRVLYNVSLLSCVFLLVLFSLMSYYQSLSTLKSSDMRKKYLVDGIEKLQRVKK